MVNAQIKTPKTGATAAMFAYDGGNDIRRSTQVFLSSFFNYAARVEGNGMDRAEAAMNMAVGYVEFIRANRLTTEQSAYFKAEFLRTAWAQESLVVFELCELANKSLILSEPEVSGLDVWFHVFKHPRCPRGFEVFGSAATKAPGQVADDKSLAFHAAVAARKPRVSAEAFENGPARGRFDEMLGREPFLKRLAESKPEVFGAYYESGWFDFKHECYEGGPMEPAMLVARSKVPAKVVANMLSSELGLAGACKAVKKLGDIDRGREIVDCLSRSLSANPEALKALPEKYWPQGLVDSMMGEKQVAGALDAARALVGGSKLAAFGAWAKNMVSGRQAKNEPASIEVFKSAIRQDYMHFTGTLAQWADQSKVLRGDVPRLNGVGLREFIKALPDDSPYDFKKRALEELADQLALADLSGVGGKLQSRQGAKKAKDAEKVAGPRNSA